MKKDAPAQTLEQLSYILLQKIPYKYYYDDTCTDIDKQMQQYENQLFNCRDGKTPNQRTCRLYWARKYIELKYLKHKKIILIY